MNLLKVIAAKLPLRYQQELKRLHFGRMIRNGSFQRAIENEGEFHRLHQWVQPGDWVLDIGANIGNYAARLSELVGARGRVIAVEPVPQTFELLAANVGRFPLQNVTLLNVAASDRFFTSGMQMPPLDSGGPNPYMAHLTADSADIVVVCMPLDAMEIDRPIRLIKVDVEGHELSALRGMRRLLERDRPVLIIEGQSAEVASFLSGFGYAHRQDPGSPNRVFQVGLA
jgi:FkbM family methyltransferase